MIATQQLEYRYPGGTALRFPDLTCAAGQTRLLLGPSGSGKTTLLQLLAGLRKPTSGAVLINDTDLATLPTSKLDTFRGRHIGVVFQTAHFIRSVSVLNNLRLTQQLAGKKQDDKRSHELLSSLNLNEVANKLPGNLSVGQQQRVAIARAVLNEPAVLLADEPTSALDDANAEQVLTLLQSSAAAVGAALLIVTHDSRLTSQIPLQTSL